MSYIVYINLCFHLDLIRFQKIEKMELKINSKVLKRGLFLMIELEIV